MTQQDPSTLSPQPDTPGQIPESTAEPSLSRTSRSWIPALLYLSGFLAVYLLAVWTPAGQRAENAILDLGASDAATAWIYPWSGAKFGSTPLPPLELSHTKTLIVGSAVIVLLSLIRRCWWQGCVAIGFVVVTIGSKEVLRSILPRPDLVNANDMLLEGSFPSGHAIIPAALTLGVILVASPRVRPYLATVGVLWFACIAAAVQALGHHRPSDVLGAALLACACYSLAIRLLPTAVAPDITHGPRALSPVVLTLSAAVALASGVRSDTLWGSLINAVTAFVCAVLLWYTIAGSSLTHGRPNTPYSGLTTRQASDGERRIRAKRRSDATVQS